VQWASTGTGRENDPFDSMCRALAKRRLESSLSSGAGTQAGPSPGPGPAARRTLPAIMSDARSDPRPLASGPAGATTHEKSGCGETQKKLDRTFWCGAREGRNKGNCNPSEGKISWIITIRLAIPPPRWRPPPVGAFVADAFSPSPGVFVCSGIKFPPPVTHPLYKRTPSSGALVPAGAGERNLTFEPEHGTSPGSSALPRRTRPPSPLTNSRRAPSGGWMGSAGPRCPSTHPIANSRYAWIIVRHPAHAGRVRKGRPARNRNGAPPLRASSGWFLLRSGFPSPPLKPRGRSITRRFPSAPGITRGVFPSGGGTGGPRGRELVPSKNTFPCRSRRLLGAVFSAPVATIDAKSPATTSSRGFSRRSAS